MVWNFYHMMLNDWFQRLTHFCFSRGIVWFTIKVRLKLYILPLGLPISHNICFYFIWALMSKSASKVSSNHIDIFTIFGMPHTQYCDKGPVFTTFVISEFWNTNVTRTSYCLREVNTTQLQGTRLSGHEEILITYLLHR